jgi:hypothetical protein
VRRGLGPPRMTPCLIGHGGGVRHFAAVRATCEGDMYAVDIGLTLRVGILPGAGSKRGARPGSPPAQDWRTLYNSIIMSLSIARRCWPVLSAA